VSEGISLTDLAAQLNLAKSTVSHRVKNGIRGDWIRNLETRKGHPARLVRGAPLPEIRPALPTVDDVRQALDSRTPVEHPKNADSTDTITEPFACSTGFCPGESCEPDVADVARPPASASNLSSELTNG